MSAVPELFYDVEQALKKVDKGPYTMVSDHDRYYGRLAAVMSCWRFGHPKQPKAKQKYLDQPWRCERCESWWVTVIDRDPIGSWYKWARVWKDD